MPSVRAAAVSDFAKHIRKRHPSGPTRLIKQRNVSERHVIGGRSTIRYFWSRLFLGGGGGVADCEGRELFGHYNGESAILGRMRAAVTECGEREERGGRNYRDVATSRARCACIVVGSPLLLSPECRTPPGNGIGERALPVQRDAWNGLNRNNNCGHPVQTRIVFCALCPAGRELCSRRKSSHESRRVANTIDPSGNAAPTHVLRETSAHAWGVNDDARADRYPVPGVMTSTGGNSAGNGSLKPPQQEKHRNK